MAGVSHQGLSQKIASEFSDIHINEAQLRRYILGNKRINMQLHHYEQFYKFYLYSDELSSVNIEDAINGIGIPSGSTTLNPPLNECMNNEIPIFENFKWKIVKNDFWIPKIDEINYDAGRSIKTFEFIEPNMHDFMNFPSMPQLCNTNLVGIRISQSLIIINKKFSQCIEMHKMILEGNGNNCTYSPNKDSMTFSPSIIHEFKTEIESIVFIMRRVLDSLVQLTDLMVNFTDYEKSKILRYESIGSLLSVQAKESEVKSIILGDKRYKKDHTQFLLISNNLFNGYKHSLMNDESFTRIGESVPTFIGFLVKYANHKKIIQYHNHNAFHFMMGFQDCILRILKNQDIYRKKIKKN